MIDAGTSYHSVIKKALETGVFIDTKEISQQTYTVLHLTLLLSLCSSIRKSFGFKYVVRFSTHNTHLSERNLRALRIFLSILWARTKSLNSIFSTYKGETDGWLLHRTYNNALLVF